MEALRTNSRIEKQIHIWELAAKILPTAAIGIIVILWWIEPITALDYFLCVVSISLCIVTVTWWWWIMHMVRKVNILMENSIKSFDQIGKEIKSIKADLRKQRNDGDRKR